MKSYKYELKIIFEAEEKCEKLKENDFIQFENGLVYFLQNNINNTYVYGSGKIKLKRVKK